MTSKIKSWGDLDAGKLTNAPTMEALLDIARGTGEYSGGSQCHHCALVLFNAYAKAEHRRYNLRGHNCHVKMAVFSRSGWMQRGVLYLLGTTSATQYKGHSTPHRLLYLVALYRAMRLRFGYGFESCDANGLRNVKNTNLWNTGPLVFTHFSLLVVRNWSWKCRNEGNFALRFVWQSDVAIRVPKEH